MLKKIILVLSLFVFLFLVILSRIYFYPQNLGEKPSGAYKESFKKYANYSEDAGGFVNEDPTVIEKMLSRSSEWDSFYEYYWPTTVGWPDVKIKEVAFDKEIFNSKKGIHFVWFGHSTILLRVEGINILIDPVFSKFASPLSFIAKRFQKPIIKLKDLPKIDYVLISHDHYDHLDRESIEYFKDKKETKFLVPLGVRSHLNFWGIKKNLIIDFNWWGSVNFAGTKFTFTPAQHFSGRTKFIDNATLWGGWMIEAGEKSIFFSGDSGYAGHFKEIAKRFPKIDYAFLENGQYNWRWQAVHMMPDETAKAFKDLRAQKLIPIHWGMFNFSLHNWYDPPIDLSSECSECKVIIPFIGEIVDPNSEYPLPSEMYNFLLEQKDRYSK
tara:strand:- start:153527 stop:154672 length:1146 start_codon:yes stop_codon:yes gene_type:complete